MSAAPASCRWPSCVRCANRRASLTCAPTSPAATWCFAVRCRNARWWRHWSRRWRHTPASRWASWCARRPRWPRCGRPIRFPMHRAIAWWRSSWTARRPPTRWNTPAAASMRRWRWAGARSTCTTARAWPIRACAFPRPRPARRATSTPSPSWRQWRRHDLDGCSNPALHRCTPADARLMDDVLLALIEALEHERSLDAPDRLHERIEALDRLDALAPAEDKGRLARRARAIRQRLEAANALRFEAIRVAIRRGEGSDALAAFAGDGEACRAGDAYDWRDELVAGVLPFGEPGAA